MEELFRKWFEVVYRDDPEQVDEIVSIWQDVVDDDDEEATWNGDEIFTDFLLHNELGDGTHFFAIDWKDADSFIAYLDDDVAERFELRFDWSEQNREEDDVETLLQLAAQKLAQHDVALYSLDTQSDLYYFVFIPNVDKSDFERVSQEWGIGYQLIQA
ncbi:hypothetical protein MIS45_01470 [Wielerella bovis]|uniref:DUF6630 family protein n=1 Tax=Wielerella bovis TaxID=2917790 RepID=UPI00201969C0|nr:hypothetical protein [Wielerella bovis]ULJ69560.1 hypothetical protein MIS45_01470 [Wielerella bovis]